MKQWLLSALVPLALAVAWKWVQGSGPEAVAGALVKGVLRLEALLVARWPALAVHRKEANKAIEDTLRKTADELEKEDQRPQP